jgi:hypothetical protein
MLADLIANHSANWFQRLTNHEETASDDDDSFLPDDDGDGPGGDIDGSAW